jgi:hypothetical protein
VRVTSSDSRAVVEVSGVAITAIAYGAIDGRCPFCLYTISAIDRLLSGIIEASGCAEKIPL